MTLAEKQLLIAQRTAERDAAQAALDEALAIVTEDESPPAPQRYRVSLGDVVDANGYAVQECIINGQFVQANASVASVVNPDANFNLGWFVLSTPIEQCPDPVTVGEQMFNWEVLI